MRLFVAIIVAAAALLSVNAPANAWYCSSRSTTGQWGWGSSYYLGNARGIAMRECVVRTPRYGTCYIMYCR